MKLKSLKNLNERKPGFTRILFQHIKDYNEHISCTLFDMFYNQRIVDHIPKNLTHIRGSLYLTGSSVSKLTHRLYIEDSLMIGNTEIEDIPEYVTVNGRVYLGICPFYYKLLKMGKTNEELKVIYPNIKNFFEQFPKK